MIDDEKRRKARARLIYAALEAKEPITTKMSIQAILEASTTPYVTLKQVLTAYHGRFTTNKEYVKEVEDAMAACGWEYHTPNKVWQPKNTTTYNVGHATHSVKPGISN